MTGSFWRRQRRSYYVRHRHRRFQPKLERVIWQIHPLLLMLAIGIFVCVGVVRTAEWKMRPMLTAVAETQIQNRVTQVLEKAVAQDLEQRQFQYEDLLVIQRDGDGKITALTTDMAQMNLFRNDLVERILLELECLDSEPVQVPVGSLINSELFWGKGPDIKVRAFTVGTVSAEFESEFLDAGVNQTLHKIWLLLSVPVKILLPDSQLESRVDTRICISETVIVGQVPNFLQKAYQ